MEAEVRRGLTALVVDDEENMVHVLTTLLAQEGFGVAAARTGDEALERIRSEVVDLVLLDVRLPGRDGLEVLEAVKARATVGEISDALREVYGLYREDVSV